jgi:hypothetical protein
VASGGARDAAGPRLSTYLARRMYASSATRKSSVHSCSPLAFIVVLAMCRSPSSLYLNGAEKAHGERHVVLPTIYTVHVPRNAARAFRQSSLALLNGVGNVYRRPPLSRFFERPMTKGTCCFHTVPLHQKAVRTLTQIMVSKSIEESFTLAPIGGFRPVRSGHNFSTSA